MQEDITVAEYPARFFVLRDLHWSPSGQRGSERPYFFVGWGWIYMPQPPCSSVWLFRSQLQGPWTARLYTVYIMSTEHLGKVCYQVVRGRGLEMRTSRVRPRGIEQRTLWHFLSSRANSRSSSWVASSTAISDGLNILVQPRMFSGASIARWGTQAVSNDHRDLLCMW